MGVTSQYIFKNGLKVRFRAVKPSDEETMRRLFYRISGRTIYRRFFYPIKTMPHNKMQEYVNIDYQNEMSIVGLIKENDQDIIIAEARYARDERTALGEVAFIVDERFQGLGIGRYIYNMLIRLAKERGLTGFTAEVLYENTEMMKVFEKGDLPVEARLQNGIYSLTILFDTPET
jgi:GNAT superfamily N-acetyltransferase